MHPTQLEILDSLRLDDSRKFNELLRDVAETSDNLSYHLKQLIKVDYIDSPNKGEYRLGQKGLVYLNNNLELGHDIFPTVSCMLELHGEDGKILVMKKLKQPYLGSLHLLTFGVTSAKTLQAQLYDFVANYRIHAADITYQFLYRERTKRADQTIFDKFFLVYTGVFRAFETQVDDRQFVALPIADILSNPDVLPASKAVLSGKQGDFEEAITKTNT